MPAEPANLRYQAGRKTCFIISDIGFRRCLEDRSWITGNWGVAENNRKARFYSLTKKGRAQLGKKTTEARAIELILGPETQEGR